MAAKTFTRELEIGPLDAAKDAAAPIPCTIATTTPVDRGDFQEILDCTAAGVDLSRAPLSLLVAHDAGSLAVGTVTDLKADGERVRGLVRFASSDDAQQIRADVVAGTHRYLSVGYQHTNNGTETDAGIVFTWQPYEASIVPVPADPNAGFFRALTLGALASGLTPTAMNQSQTPTAAPAAENRAADIVALCTHHNVPQLAERMIRSGATMDATRAAVLEELARRDAAAGGHLNVTLAPAGQNARSVILESLVERMGGKAKGPTIRNADLLGLAQRSMEAAGQRVYDDTSRERMIQRAFSSTSDFPKLLGDAVGRVLLETYLEQPSAIKNVARQVTLSDFRRRQIVRLSGAPSLEAVAENDEYTTGTFSERDAGWGLVTFGRIFQLTRQAIINDDLSGFADLVRTFADAAARREADELAAVLTTPPQIDGAALFAQARKTEITDALDIDGLRAAVLALRQQTGVGGELITQNPGTLLVPAALEMVARQLVAQISAGTTDAVQPFALQIQVEPRLDAAGQAAHWYLVASNQRALEYGYLERDPGPRVIEREGFEVDGTEFKCSLDFGCGWASPVGWVHATGADA